MSNGYGSTSGDLTAPPGRGTRPAIVAVVVAVALVGVGLIAVTGWTPLGEGLRDSIDLVRGDRLESFDSNSAVDGQVEALPGDTRQGQPTQMPAGYVRCSTPTESGQVTTTLFCGDTHPAITLAQGPPSALPQEGQRIEVGRRIGFVQRSAEVATVTVSVSDDPQADHFRLTVDDPDASLGHMAGILASVPAISQAPSTTVRDS